MESKSNGAPKIIYLTDDARTQKRGRCPYCGEEVAADAKKCDHCSRLLDPSIDPVEKTPSERAVNFDSLGYVKSALASKYEVIEEIAKTDTSTVFRAIHLQLRREVALKVLLRNIVSQDHDYTDRFHRRARAIDKLSQNNIITIYDEGVESGIHYMAMEFLKGMTLQRKIAEDGPLSPEELISILMPAIGALGHAHSNGILHGNVKCSSIFLHEDGRIILFGFGIPQLTKGNQLSFKRDANSMEYLSPEESSGKSADGRSDIYSLGVVMYFSLTARLPYSGLNPTSIMSAIINNQYVPINKLSQVPQWLERIVDKCLQRDISKRVQSCGELLGMLNIKPPAQPTQVRRPAPPTIESRPTEPPAEKEVETESIAAKAPPVIEKPVEKAPPVVEQPKVRATPHEEPVTRPPRSWEDKVNREGAREPAARPTAKAEERAREKSKSHLVGWIAAIMVVGIVGVAVMMVMNRSANVNEPVAPSVVKKQVETTKERNKQPAAVQENVNKESQSAAENAEQVETPAAGIQETAPAAENNEPASSKATSKSRSSERNNLSPSKAVSKGRVAPEREAAPSTESAVNREEGTVQPAVVFVTVPDLTGTQLNVARSILSLNGLSAGAVTTIPDPANDGMVVRQVPKPGTKLKKGSTVNLILGSK